MPYNRSMKQQIHVSLWCQRRELMTLCFLQIWMNRGNKMLLPPRIHVSTTVHPNISTGIAMHSIYTVGATLETLVAFYNAQHSKPQPRHFGALTRFSLRWPTVSYAQSSNYVSNGWQGHDVYTSLFGVTVCLEECLRRRLWYQASKEGGSVACILSIQFKNEEDSLFIIITILF